MALTDSWLKANHKKPQENATEKADGDGLSARVSPQGKIVFQMRYRVGGKPARLDLGTYPLLSLREARLEHARLKAELEKGHDPRTIRKVERAEIAGQLTNEQLYRDFHEKYCLANKQQAGEYLRSFEIHVFPVLGDLPADQTTANQWLSLVEKVADDAPSIAERILRTAKQMHKWANRRQLMKTKPLVDVSVAEDLSIERNEAGRSLSDEEICLFWHSVDQSRMTPKSKIYLKLCLFFGCRNGELRNIDPRTELDFEAMTWVVPPEKNKIRKKIRRAITRPLIPEVVPLLKEALSYSRSKQHLFTQDSSPKVLDSSSVLSYPYAVIGAAKRRFGVDMEHWSLHDLRKTARTNFSSITDVHVAEVMLGHSLKGMQGVYDRHLYLEEQALAYKKWWDRIQEIVATPPQG